MGCCLTVRVGWRTVEACAVGDRDWRFVTVLCLACMEYRFWTWYHVGICLME